MVENNVFFYIPVGMVFVTVVAYILLDRSWLVVIEDKTRSSQLCHFSSHFFVDKLMGEENCPKFIF